MRSMEKIKRELQALDSLIERKARNELYLNESMARLLSMKRELEDEYAKKVSSIRADG